MNPKNEEDRDIKPPTYDSVFPPPISSDIPSPSIDHSDLSGLRRESANHTTAGTFPDTLPARSSRSLRPSRRWYEGRTATAAYTPLGLGLSYLVLQHFNSTPSASISDTYNLSSLKSPSITQVRYITSPKSNWGTALETGATVVGSLATAAALSTAALMAVPLYICHAWNESERETERERVTYARMKAEAKREKEGSGWFPSIF